MPPTHTPHTSNGRVRAGRTAWALVAVVAAGCSWTSASSLDERLAKTEAALATACASPEREEPRRALVATCEEQAIACDGSASAQCARIAGICNRGLRACADAPKP